ncbi:MAG: F0F1 ATP synthase subunit gamma [Acetobacterales bacterium]
MANLRDLRNRIRSVKSTQKITSAMKMVAASKLRRAQAQAESARPYAERMERMLKSMAASVVDIPGAPALLAGTGKDDVHLLVVITSDRGLCGAFNSQVVRSARQTIRRLEDEGKTVKLICVGRKGRDLLRRTHRESIKEYYQIVGRRGLQFSDVDIVVRKILQMIEDGEIDRCSVIYNQFISVISQKPVVQQLVPLALDGKNEGAEEEAPAAGGALYEYEPSEEAVVSDLLPRNLAVQVYRATLESAAGEHGARMSAMDNATRNAGDMIDRLTLEFNRTRQATITTELIEIISGAEAL